MAQLFTWVIAREQTAMSISRIRAGFFFFSDYAFDFVYHCIWINYEISTAYSPTLWKATEEKVTTNTKRKLKIQVNNVRTPLQNRIYNEHALKFTTSGSLCFIEQCDGLFFFLFFVCLQSLRKMPNADRWKSIKKYSEIKKKWVLR